MTRRLIFWLLLVCQLSIGVLGARAAEISVLGAAHLFMVDIASQNGSQHVPWQITRAGMLDLDEADTVRPRKGLELRHPASCVQGIRIPHMQAIACIDNSFPDARIAAKTCTQDKQAAMFKAKTSAKYI